MRTMGIWLAVLLVAVLAGCGPGTPEVLPMKAGNCLRETEAGDDVATPARIPLQGVTYRDVVATACSDPRSFATITAVAKLGSGCPIDTDTVFAIGFSSPNACSRNLREPHEGDVGQGGGLLRVGDCLALDLADDGVTVRVWPFKEVTCSGPARSGTVVHRVVRSAATVAGCGKKLVAFGRKGAGIPQSSVGDEYPDNDWPASYGPVLCVEPV